MASAISSAAMVIALGKAGLLGSFGAAGLPPARLEAAIQQIQAELPEGPYAFNLIHSPNEEALERRAVELYLRTHPRGRGIRFSGSDPTYCLLPGSRAIYR